MTADQRKELEALEAEMRARRDAHYSMATIWAEAWAARIAAVLADGGEEG